MSLCLDTDVHQNLALEPRRHGQMSPQGIKAYRIDFLSLRLRANLIRSSIKTK